jgi:hypothetical protein
MSEKQKKKNVLETEARRAMYQDLFTWRKYDNFKKKSMIKKV